MSNKITLPEQKLEVKDKVLAEVFKKKYSLTEDFVNEAVSLPVLQLVYPIPGEDPKIIDNKQYREIDGVDVPLYNFFHKESKKILTDPTVVVMAVQRAKLPDFTKPDVLKYNELVAGFLVEEKLPFVIFIKSLALDGFWKYRKQLSTLAKQTGVPAHALTARLTTEKKKSMDGKFNVTVPKFELLNEYVGDIDTFNLISDNIQVVKDGLKQFVDMKSNKEIQELSEEIDLEDLPA